MPILFTCPHCESQTLIEERYGGQTGPCATCGKTITIPWVERSQQTGSSGTGTATLGIPATRPVTMGTATVVDRKRSHRWVILVTVLAGLAAAASMIMLAVMLVFPTVTRLRAASEVSACQAHLRQIAAALNAYRDAYGSYPPAYIADDAGKPMHSWRVLILPYLNQAGLYQQYKFDEPWDSLDNSRLLASMPEVYGCPTGGGSQVSFETSYVLVTGPNTLFPANQTSSLATLRDSAADTILVVERSNSNIAWTEPRDLDISSMLFQVNGGTTEIGSDHLGGAQVATVDSLVHELPDETPAETVRGLITPAGGEAVAWPQ